MRPSVPLVLLRIQSPYMRDWGIPSLSRERIFPPSEFGPTYLRTSTSIPPSQETFPYSRPANVLEPRHRNGNSLHVRMADTDIHALDPRLLRRGFGIPVQLVLLAKIRGSISHQTDLELTVTTGAPLSSLPISISFNPAPAPLLSTPRLLNTASLALHRPAKLACALPALRQ